MNEQTTKPPRWALRFLAAICPDYLLEEIEGDLYQRFYRDIKNHGEKRAKRRFVWNTLRFFRPGIILRNNFSPSLLSMYMLANYFKIASRVMLRSKSFSLINVSGLALGITSAILLFLWIDHEFSYDQFHENKTSIYKVWNRTTINGQLQAWDRTPRVLAPTLAADFSAVESAVSYVDYGAAYLFTVGETRLMKNAGVFTDPEFLTMFSFPLLKGKASQALVDANSIVLTEDFAKQLFGDKEAFGETVTIWDSGHSFPFTVTGILKELPSNTDFHFEYIIPFGFLESLEGKQIDWENNSTGTFIKLKQGTDLLAFNEEIKDVTKQHSKSGSDTEIFLYPLTKLHLYSRFENGVPAGGRVEVMRMIGILGICLVLIACINFVNLSTARAQKRSKEVGVRKVTGAQRYALVTQFLCESVLLALVAGVLSLGLVYLFLPFFNELVQQKLSLNFQHVNFWLIAFGGIIGIGLLAGSYPAIYLSSFSPVRILKGASIATTNRNFFRKTLVILQFGFATTLLFSVVVVQKQIGYVQNRESGYDRDNLVYHFITGDLEKNYPAYKNELLQLGLVTSVTKTSAPITEGWSNTWALEWEGKDPESKDIIERFYADEDITTTAGLSLVAGRDMDLEKYPSDSSGVLLNEAAVKLMGFKNPIGEIIKDGKKEWRVVGVVKDFVLTSPHQKIKPIAMMGAKGWFTVVHMRLSEHKNVQENLAGISNVFTKYNAAYPFDYYFVDATYQRKFASLEKTRTITTLFSSIVIFIACLGLLGLSTYMIEARTKEVGIRKVLGGSVLGITKLLCWSSLKPIIIAILFFSPLAWMSMSWWLQTYEYRITLHVGILITSGTLLVLIALLTVGIQTMRAANVNPVKSLKTE